MPEPTAFLSRKFPVCSIILPTNTQGAAMGAVKGLTADGLFIGQTPAFFAAITQLANRSRRSPRRHLRPQRPRRFTLDVTSQTARGSRSQRTARAARSRGRSSALRERPKSSQGRAEQRDNETGDESATDGKGVQGRAEATRLRGHWDRTIESVTTQFKLRGAMQGVGLSRVRHVGRRRENGPAEGEAV